MNIITVCVILVLLTAIGSVIINWLQIFPKKSNLLTISYGYGLGAGLVAVQLYVYSRLSVPWQREYIIGPFLLLLIFFLIKKKSTILYLPRIPKFKIGKIEILLLLGIFLSTGYTVFQALIRPVTVWDAWASWLLRANIFFIDGRVTEKMLQYLQVDYPYVISTLSAFIYVMLDSIDDTAVLLISVAYYLFLALLFFSVLRKRFGIKYALLFTFLMVTIQNLIRHGGRLEAGQADLPLGYYAFASTVLLLEYIKSSNAKVLLLLSIFLGFTGLIKSEGVVLSAIIGFFAFLHIYKKKAYSHLFALIFWLAPILDWQVYKKIYHLDSLYFYSHHIEMSIDKTIGAFMGTFKELTNIKSWNMLWIIYFYSLFLFRKIRSNEIFILNIVIIIQLSFYLLMYNFTAGNTPESSIQRLLMHLAPLALFVIALMTRILLRH